MSRLSEAVATTVTVDEDVTPDGSPVIVLTLIAEDPARPAVLGPRGLANLDAALDDVVQRMAGAQFAAVIVRGAGRAFCAGADLDMMASITDRALSLTLAESGHRVLSRLSRLGVPTIAEVNGVALGGGLELALHCTHRVAARSVVAIGLPEISLGLIPGWGGATLLPRLIGFPNARVVLLDNPVKGNVLLTATRAHELGVVDAVSDDESLHADVLSLIDAGLDVAREARSVSAEDLVALRDAVSSYSNRPANPALAMGRLVDVIAAGDTVGHGFAAEDDALADLIVTSEFRDRVYSFHLTTSRARKPAGVPSEAPMSVQRIGVIGAGLMATQFALLFAEKLAIPVTLTDVSEERLAAALSRMDEALATRVERGTLTPEARNAIRANLRTTMSTEDFAECDFVMEAVFEDLDVKVAVLRDVERHVTAQCILATNTSSLSVTAMAESLTHPDRLIGFHFFNPVAVMPLIEVVATTHSAPSAISTAVSVAGLLRKTPVITADLPGFVVNRVLSVFLSEALSDVENVIAAADVSRALAPLRLPMDPFALIDLIGREVTVHMLESLHAFAPARVSVSPVLVAATAQPRSDSFAADCGVGRSATTEQREAIHDRTCDALARELQLMLDDDVVADVKDIDLCMIVGAGWPVAHGGISRYLDECGASERVLGRRFH